MRLSIALAVLATACAAPYRAAHETAAAEARALAAYRDAPAETAAQLRARFLRADRVAIDEEPAPDFSQGVRLEEAIRAAIASNPQLRAAVQHAIAAVEQIPQAAFPPTPDLTVEPTASLSGNGLALHWVEAMLMQMFPVPGMLDAQVGAALAAARQAVAEARALEHQIRAEVAHTVAELYALDRAREINDANRATLDGIVRAVEAAYRAARASQRDLLRAQLRRQEIDLRDLELRTRRRAMAARLNELANRPAALPVGPATLPEATPALPDLGLLLEKSEEHRPELAAAGRRLQAAIEGLRMAELGRAPEWTIGAGPYWENPTDGQDMWMLDALVSLPLKWLHAPKYDAAVRQATSHVAAALDEYRAMRLQVHREIVAAHADLAEAVETLRLLEDRLVPTARQTLRAAEAAYASAQIDLDALLQAQIDLQDFGERLARARAGALHAAEHLRHAVGKEVHP